jgi:cell division protein FtsW
LIATTRTRSRSARSVVSPARQSRGRAPLRYVALLAIVLLLLLTGVVLVLTASTVASIDETSGSLFYFSRHVQFAVAGLLAMLVTLRIDYRWWRKASLVLVSTSVAGLITVLVVAREINGSKRWIEAGPINVQPSEFAKLALVVALATFLDSRRNQLAKRHRILHPVGLSMAVVCVLMMLQPDLGTALILLAITGGMLFAAGLPGRQIAAMSSVVGTLGFLAALAAPYRRSRMLGFINPIDSREDAGYQTFQSLVGLANGGVTGVGLGEGRAKWGWLPNSHTDFIFAIVAEELGLVGGLIILGLLGAVGVLGFRIAQGAPDFFGGLLAAGITVWLMVQVVVNMGGVLGLLPITGVTLPFLSFGGSSLLVNAAAAGVLLNVARQS